MTSEHELNELLSEDANYAQRANEILEKGDPVGFIMSVYNKLHVGDEATGKLILMCIGCQSVKNSDGLHPGLTGMSGSGKTHACKVMAHLTPKEYLISGSISPMSLYFGPPKPGSVIFLDDTQRLDKKLEDVIKTSVSNYLQGQLHRTVDNRKPLVLFLPPRLMWMITSVDGAFDSQVLNRFLSLKVDDTPEQDRRVMEYALRKAVKGEESLPEDEDVLTCREVIRMLKQNVLHVIIPYAAFIHWARPENRRNLGMFLDTIKAFAAIRSHQREQYMDGQIIATLDDFDDARTLWELIKEEQVSKMTRDEMRLYQVLIDDFKGKATRPILLEKLGWPDYQLTRVAMGIKNDDGERVGGLAQKIPGFSEYRESLSKEEGTGHRTISIKGYEIKSRVDLLANFGSLVEISPNDKAKVNDIIKAGLNGDLDLTDYDAIHKFANDLQSICSTETREGNGDLQCSHVLSFDIGAQPSPQPISMQGLNVLNVQIDSARAERPNASQCEALCKATPLLSQAEKAQAIRKAIKVMSIHKVGGIERADKNSVIDQVAKEQSIAKTEVEALIDKWRTTGEIMEVSDISNKYISLT